MSEQYGGYISKLEFNNFKTLDLKQNSIVVIVGPNNAGKSRALIDILNLVKDTKTEKHVVLNRIDFQYQNKNISYLTNSVCDKDDIRGVYHYYGDTFTVYDVETFGNGDGLEELTKLFVSNLNTEERLTFCKPVDNIDINERKRHPLHYIVSNMRYTEFISKEFERAFGTSLIPNTNHKRISLHVGNQIILNDSYENERLRQTEFTNQLDLLPQIQDQGDGMRSFTSILLNLCIDYRRIFLIDEPESFLHQPQAKMMGRLIGEHLKDDQQAFISTHNQEIIKGLLEVAEDRVTIVRITRKDEKNDFKILDNASITSIVDDSMLLQTDILSGLFYENVVICESDSDCLFFSNIDNFIKQKENEYSKTLFLHANGKDKIKKVAKALIGLGVETKCIFDLDILNNKENLKSLCEIYQIEWKVIKDELDCVEKWLSKQPDCEPSKKEIIQNVLEESKKTVNENFNRVEKQRIIHFLKGQTIWDKLKKDGLDVVNDDTVKKSLSNILSLFAHRNVFIIPYGEIESLVPAEGHSYSWIENVFKKYPNFNDDIYLKAIEFTKLMNL